MATNVAQKLKSIEDFIQELKLVTSTPTPTKIALSTLASQFRVSHYTIAALNDLGVLKYEMNGTTKLVQWGYGAGKIDNKLISQVYESAKKEEREKKKKSVANIAAKGIAPAPKEQAPPIQEKQQPQPAKAEAPKVAPAPKPQKQEEAFAAELGIIFGYKQLQYMQEEHFKKPTDVIINKGQTIPKVDLVTYTVEDSNLAIRFYRGSREILNDTEMIEECLLTEIRVSNTVLGLRRAGGDSQMHIVNMSLVPVKNPYRLL